MLTFWKRRKLKKAVHQILHESAHARHLREDVARPADLDAVLAAEQALKAAWKAGAEEKELDPLAAKIHEAVEKIYPARPGARIRENVEIVVVALAVAMAFRTHFLMPFKIPTNSMWPTLYGITVDPNKGRDIFDTFPLNVGRAVVSGEWYVEVRAKEAGVPMPTGTSGDDFEVVRIGSSLHSLPRYETGTWTFVPGAQTMVQKGQILAAGRKRLGDFLFVNRMAYNFRRPIRGDVIVFSTQDVQHPNVRTNDHYIKRLVALPGEKVELKDDRHVEIDGKPLEEPWPFKRLLTKAGKYEGLGYTLPRRMYFDGHRELDPSAWLAQSKQPRVLSPTQFLPFGDNTEHSLDGRFFGPIERDRLVGPALVVYWPFGERWGLIH